MMIALIKRFETKTKEWKTERLCRWYLDYPNTIKKIRCFLKNKYALVGAANDEFKHFLSFLKYKAGTNSIFIMNVHGTREEIDKLQQAPDLSQPSFSN